MAKGAVASEREPANYRHRRALAPHCLSLNPSGPRTAETGIDRPLLPYPRGSQSLGVKQIHPKGRKRWSGVCGIGGTDSRSGLRSEAPPRCAIWNRHAAAGDASIVARGSKMKTLGLPSATRGPKMEILNKISAWLPLWALRIAGWLSHPKCGGGFREGIDGLPGVSGHVLELQARFTF
jgi:hypothetical protein